MHRSFVRLIVLLTLVVLGAAACGSPSGNAPSAESLLPTLNGYRTVEAQSLQDFLTGLGSAAGALSFQPEMIAVVNVVDRVADCYRDAGAIGYRLYSKESNPVIAGAVAIANRDLLTNPQMLLQCTGLAPAPQAQAEGQGGFLPQPCTASYNADISGDTFMILYAGTDIEICQAFCRALTNCAAHR